MSFQVQGKSALVTGANRGIGLAIVEGLIAAGAAKVYAGVRQISNADELVGKYGGKVIPVHMDLTDAESLQQAANKAVDASLVINNAGVLKMSPVLGDSVFDDLTFELETNLFGLIRMAQAFAPVLKRNGGGAFVQINSVVSMKCFPQFSTYCASKAAAYSITQALRSDLSTQGTHVMSVHPGPIKTDMGASAGLIDIAEPPALVCEAIIQGLTEGAFHVYPDSLAKRIGQAYQSFAQNVIEVDTSEG